MSLLGLDIDEWANRTFFSCKHRSIRTWIRFHNRVYIAAASSYRWLRCIRTNNWKCTLPIDVWRKKGARREDSLNHVCIYYASLTQVAAAFGALVTAHLCNTGNMTRAKQSNKGTTSSSVLWEHIEFALARLVQAPSWKVYVGFIGGYGLFPRSWPYTAILYTSTA